MKSKYVLLIAFVLFFMKNMGAQVTMGSGNAPASFSILQLDGTHGGLRLPQLGPDAIKNIENLFPPINKDQAGGLMLFNTETHKVEYWNGTRWTTAFDVKAKNGLTVDSTDYHIKLGGDLYKTTSINLGKFDLQFVKRSNSFTIYDKVFDITGKNMTLTTPSLSVVDSLNLIFNANGNNLYVNPSGIGNFSINASKVNKMEVLADSVTITGSVIYKDEQNATPTAFKEDVVLVAADTLGTARWASLRPESKIRKGKLRIGLDNISTYGKTSPGGDGAGLVNITEEPLNLSSGKWLVFVNFETKATARNANNSNPDLIRRYNIWLHLYNEKNGVYLGDNRAIAVTATNAEIDVSNSSHNYGFNLRAYPSLVFLLDTNDKSLNLKMNADGTYSFYAFASTWNADTYLQNTQWEFIAISIVDDLAL